MSNKTINQALKDLFLGLGGNSSALADNTSASDYIEDLESAIKATASDAAGDIIDDSEASETKAYSSSKVESLIPAPELPTPASTNVGKVATVVSDGEDGYEWSAEDVVIPQELPTVTIDDNGKILAVVAGEWTLVTMSAVADTSTGAVTFTFTPDSPAE